MRTIFLIPLAAVTAVVAGCGSGGSKQVARSVPQRDLTLVAQTSELKFASPVEVQNLRVQRRSARPSQPAARIVLARRSGRPEPKVELALVRAPAPMVATSKPVAQPTSTAATPANDRELLPGTTVTVIPASTGPSTGSDQTDEAPPDRGRPMVARGGGTCRGRGRGPGIGTGAAPRPDFR